MASLEPEEYTGEELCPRCGAGKDTGNRYKICAEGVKHEDSCALYNYGWLCWHCEKEVMGDDLYEI